MEITQPAVDDRQSIPDGDCFLGQQKSASLFARADLFVQFDGLPVVRFDLRRQFSVARLFRTGRRARQFFKRLGQPIKVFESAVAVWSAIRPSSVFKAAAAGANFS